jgi:hypothetical protein
MTLYCILVPYFLFICSLYNNAVSISDYIASNDWIVVKK